jgi:hypothetical protein
MIRKNKISYTLNVRSIVTFVCLTTLGGAPLSFLQLSSILRFFMPGGIVFNIIAMKMGSEAYLPFPRFDFITIGIRSQPGGSGRSQV